MSTLTAAYFDLGLSSNLRSIIDILGPMISEKIGRNSFKISAWFDYFAGVNSELSEPLEDEFEGVATDLRVLFETIFEQFKDDRAALKEYYQWARMYNASILLEPLIRTHVQKDLTSKSVEDLIEIKAFWKDSEISFPELEDSLRAKMRSLLGDRVALRLFLDAILENGEELVVGFLQTWHAEIAQSRDYKGLPGFRACTDYGELY